MKLSDTIKKFRKERGLTQDEFANLCGLSKSTLSIVERGGVNPNNKKPLRITGDTIIKLANAMGYTYDELVRISDDAYHPEIDPNDPDLAFALNRAERIFFVKFRALHPMLRQFLMQSVGMTEEEMRIPGRPSV